MARGVGEIQGWPAVAWVAGCGAVLLLLAGVLYWRARSHRDKPATLPTYRSAGAAGSTRAANLIGLAIILVLLCAVTQLLYVGLYIELAQWLLGAREPPRISGDLFFWVLIIDVTCAGGAAYSGLRNPPGDQQE